jgi:hypothetical protein
MKNKNSYEVSMLLKDKYDNPIYSANIVITNLSPVDVGLWYKENKKNVIVIGIDIATKDSIKPGKPVINI